jgi:hypothetical protein
MPTQYETGMVKFEIKENLMWNISLSMHATRVHSIFECLSEENSLKLFSVCHDKLQCSCHLPAPGRNRMTHCEALEDFPNIRQISLHKNNKINFPVL